MAHEHDSHGHGHHIIPVKVYWAVFIGLLFFTIITVLAAYVNLGPLNIPLALAIAGAKATLVVMFFMALKYDKKINVMIFSIGLLFVLVFMGFVLLDTEFRGEFDPIQRGTVAEQQATEAQLESRIESVNAELQQQQEATQQPEAVE
jgi:cytochrome c oxidase subunit 4